MLQRAGSNAYSWWWASHIRTKQSKWLEHNLQDMEDRVSNMLKIIDEDGDSFAKRAEMYNRKRPELRNFVDESYRAYRALAERYDHISRDMQNANRTIASAFPEQVQFMDDDDDEHSQGKFISTKSSSKDVQNSNASKIPKMPMKELTSRPTFISRKKRFGRTGSAVRDTKPSPGLSKDEALGEIDHLQKGILGLQTEEEFVRSSYENGLAKYWEIENQIIEMQGRVYSLQDEFGFGTVIDDDEARALMADAALKSCQRALIRLQEKREISAQESRIECQRIEKTRRKFEILRDDLLGKQLDVGKKQDVSHSDQSAEKFEKGKHEIDSLQIMTDKNKNPNIAAEKIDEFIAEQTDFGAKPEAKQKLNELDTQRYVIESIQEKMKETFEMNSKTSSRAKQVAKKMDDLREKQIQMQENEIESLQETIRGKLEERSKTSLTATEEKIDELAEKIIALETAVSSQTASLQRLRSETDDLQIQIQVLEEEKETLFKCSDNMDNKITQIEKELARVQNLNQTIEDQNHLLQTHFTEASCNFDHLSKKQQNVKPGKAFEEEDKDQDHVINSTPTETEGEKETLNISEERDDDDPELMRSSVKSEEGDDLEENGDYSSPRRDLNVPKQVGKETEIRDDEVEETFSNPFEETFSNPFKETLGNPFGNPFESFSIIEEATIVYPHLTDKVETLPEEGEEKEKENKEIDQESTEMIHGNLYSELNESGTEDGDEPNWKQLFIDGLEKREKVLLTEYTSNLRNFKEVKKKLTQVEKMNRDSLLKSTMEIKQLKNDNTFKDEEIRSLRQKLNSLQSDETFVDDSTGASSISSLNSNQQPLYVLLNDKYFEASAKSESAAQTITNPNTEMLLASDIEQKFRAAIDDLLEENLEFWLRFSTSFHQIQKFQTSIHDLQSELSKLKEKQEGNSRHETIKSDMRPIYKHLQEIQIELKLWLKHNSLLKEKLKTRLSTLCSMEEELLVLSSSRAGSREEMSELSHFQAAKFQGEVQNMKQENHKVADVLKAGSNRVNALWVEIEGTLSKMDEDFEFCEPTNNGKSSLNRSRIPLRSLLFGVRLKKRKQQSMFACINPTLQKQSSDLTPGLPP